MLALIALVAAVLALWRVCVEPWRRQREAMAAILACGGTVQTSPATAWQRWLFGRDYQNIQQVDLADCDDPDAYIPHLIGLPHLEVLVVGGLSVSDHHIARLRSSRSLKWLVLDSTMVTGEALAELQKNLPDLRVVRSPRRAFAILRRDAVAGVSDEPRYLACPAGLEWLDADHFRTLTELRIGHAVPSNESLAWLPTLQDVEELELKGDLTDDDLRHLRPLTKLRQLTMVYAAITDAGLARIAQISDLEGLGFLWATRFTDAGMANLKALPRIRVLGLTASNITDDGLVHIARLSSLEELGLGGTRVTDAGMAHLRSLRSVRVLVLDSTQVGDAGLAQIKDLPNLEQLALDYTRVTDAGLAHLKDCKRLTHVSVLETDVTRAALTALRQALPKCRIEADVD